MPAYESPRTRFWRYVRKTETCWLWTGALSNGYGRFSVTGAVGSKAKQYRAHQWAWESVNGPVPVGLVLDHRCGVRACVNPAHLEPVTTQENARRSNRRFVSFAAVPLDEQTLF